jgi:hypothetical protein
MVIGFSPQTGARLSGGRPEPVKDASSARPCFARQTLDRTRPRVPQAPIAPVGLRGGAGEAGCACAWSTSGHSRGGQRNDNRPGDLIVELLPDEILYVVE